MNVIRPQDRKLVAGLAVALIVVFARQELFLIDRAREVERASGLGLIPALLILIVVFLFHQQGKRQEARAHAAAAESVAVAAEARAEEMERPVAFGQALGRSLDVEAIRAIVSQQLPRLAGTDEAWALARTDGHWQTLANVAPADRREVDEARREAVATRVLDADPPSASDPISLDGYVCIPMTAGGHTVGVVGIPETAGPFTEGRWRVLEIGRAHV